jgi:hypothetical protein
LSVADVPRRTRRSSPRSSQARPAADAFIGFGGIVVHDIVVKDGADWFCTDCAFTTRAAQPTASTPPTREWARAERASTYTVVSFVFMAYYSR